MYDAFTNIASWVSLILGGAALWRVLFAPFDRDYGVALGAALFALVLWAIVRNIESNLTSSHLAKLGKARSLSGFYLALTAILLIVTANPAIDPATGEPRPSAPSAETQ